MLTRVNIVYMDQIFIIYLQQHIAKNSNKILIHVQRNTRLIVTKKFVLRDMGHVNDVDPGQHLTSNLAKHVDRPYFSGTAGRC